MMCGNAGISRARETSKKCGPVGVTSATPALTSPHPLYERGHVMAEGQSTVTYREVPGFPGYRVGDDGSVWSSHESFPVRGGRKGERVKRIGVLWRPLKQSVTQAGRLTVGLYYNRKIKRLFVHRLVALAFIGPCPEGFQVCHNDGNPRNNVPGNLRYDTPKGNTADKKLHGTQHRGEQIPGAKLTQSAVQTIRGRLKQGETLAAIAKDYGVDFTLISCIKRRKVWAWLDAEGSA
jgi:hypothetical protein